MPDDNKRGGGNRRNPARPPVKRHTDPYKGKQPVYAVGADDGVEDDSPQDGVIVGKNAVQEALRAGTPIDKVFIQKGSVDSAHGHIASVAKARGIVVADADRRKLDFLSANGAHQGVVAVAAIKAYVSVSEILSIAKQRGEAPLLVVCDEITDPHNFGAIIRTAECCGAHGVILPKRRSAGQSAIISKTSAGAVNYVALARVPNITAALDELKESGVWIYGAEASCGKTLWETDLKGAAALVIGAEGKGLGRLVREHCDFLVEIPVFGQIASLNASVSAAVLLYEAVRQRTVSL